ncbi:formyltransferase family protein [Mucilaginibacter frigoritolerans]|nr:formyltransferase family protein [Mucilaginibacter frigoritolerans]
MNIGIVSNSAKLYIPLLFNLCNYKNKAGVMLYVGKSADISQSTKDTISFCNANGVTLTIENDKQDLYSWQQLYRLDIVFFVGYGNIVKVDQFADVKYGVYNIHFGKLPEFRGPSPVFWQLKKGVKELSISIHHMTKKVDSGPVVWEYNISNHAHFTYDFVNHMFCELQVRGVIEILNTINMGRKLPENVQSESNAVYYTKPGLIDVMINWNEMSADEVVDLVKACNSWNWGATTLINGFELKILDATVSTITKSQYVAGTAVVNDNSDFSVVCKDGKLLNIDYFKINNCFVPKRFAGLYGFKTGQLFGNHADNLR